MIPPSPPFPPSPLPFFQVSLVGEMGLGKSSVAAAVVTYMNDRRMFDDGIVYLKPMHGTYPIDMSYST